VTRRRGEDAIRFYGKHQPVAEASVGVTLFPEPTHSARRWMVAGVLLVGLLLAALALLLPLGRISHRLPLAGRGLAEFGLLFTISSLIPSAPPYLQRPSPRCSSLAPPAPPESLDAGF
jgi:hypothetical protein